MFHWRENWYFGRMPDGSVRIIKLAGSFAPQHWPQATDPPFREFGTVDLTIDANSWASIVSSVSAAGESANYYAAKKLHDHQ